MNKILTNQKNISPTLKFDLKKCLLTFLTAIISMVVLIWDLNIVSLGLTRSSSIISVWVFFIFIFVMMIKTGQAYKYRSIAFFCMSILFTAGFILNFIHFIKNGLSSTNGSFIRIDDIVQALIHTMNLPGKSKGLLFFVFIFLLIWGGVILAFGRGFCSWICPVGGMDDRFSCLTKNPYLKNIDKKWLNLPIAILIVIALLLFGKVIPTSHCAKDCPSKNILHAAALPINSFWGILVVLIIVFIAFCIIMPVLTGKRTMCSFICPLGRIQSLLSKIGLIRLEIDKDKCTNCKQCVNACTSFGVAESEKDGLKINGLCTKCMKCHGNCPSSAISLKIQDEKIAELYFIYPAFMFMVIFGSRMMANSIYGILSLFNV
ncbi:4Fe-4S binding protein [Pseudobacteroides cellulosolvens]|uniref:4Fe-4S ferredoxin iron-sulfur binding domain-containing protein n=1 Tax=Pseudobacteroides cellulosolvens ATCC 35603 = DSM 2933 TaxID=398512 RepID=A0A0L6JNY0_9FIRM|nr:4Fe-4S binding protein [Pseudobacteroides cellulosolvens]KNY27546.1 4Fe-4S ferredoxin iron-sulfur binding domain-containing protein [Pseudobacteroides cellulosolvens ATCC 35603 = DSM 2933]